MMGDILSSSDELFPPVHLYITMGIVATILTRGVAVMWMSMLSLVGFGHILVVLGWTIHSFGWEFSETGLGHQMFLSFHLVVVSGIFGTMGLLAKSFVRRDDLKLY